MNTLLKSFYNSFSDEELELLSKYLKRKSKKPLCNQSFNIVMDILHNCNLNCKGCGTNAKAIEHEPSKISGPSLEKIESACKKIMDFTKERNLKPFINIGGGEPFLRDDIEDIVDLLYYYFGSEAIGIDTNGTSIGSFEKIKRLLPKLSYLGISLNGLHDYHNWWANTNKFDAFNRTEELIKRLCSNREHLNKIEITSVATKNNIFELPILLKNLSEIGIKKYSVHRAIPVGRMKYHYELIPNAKEYLELLISLIKQSNNSNIDFHFHHSIENIHKALLLGETTYYKYSLNDKNIQSSIGITPEGNLVFDAWCMVDQWQNLSCGNVFYDEKTIDEMLENNNTEFYEIISASTASKRCNGCKIECSGGSRIVATASHMLLENTSSIENAYSSIDPACPYYYIKQIESEV